MMRSMESRTNESASYERIILRAKAVRERAAESLRMSRGTRKKRTEQVEAAQRPRKFRRRD